MELSDISAAVKAAIEAIVENAADDAIAQPTGMARISPWILPGMS
jgi:hypothetical protein